MKRMIPAALLCFSATAAYAQTGLSDTLKYNDLTDVTVLAVKDLDARRTSANARLVYTSKDFERFELTTIGDYLRSLPGVVMDKGNEAKDVKFRGLDKEIHPDTHRWRTYSRWWRKKRIPGGQDTAHYGRAY
jgi:hypothetical protein